MSIETISYGLGDKVVYLIKKPRNVGVNQSPAPCECASLISSSSLPIIFLISTGFCLLAEFNSVCVHEA